MAGIIGRYNKSYIFYTFLFVYAIFLIYLSVNLNIWIDEMYTLDTTSYGLKTVIKKSYDFEAQPPAYFVFLSIWRTINSSYVFARLFSGLFVLLASFVFYRLIQLISGTDRSRWLVVLFLLNPFTVWVGVETRLYAFLLFISVSSLYYFFRFYIENKNKHLVIFVLLATIGVFTQYLFVFLLAALGFSILLYKGWKLFLKYCIYLLPVGMLFLLSVWFTTNPMKLAYFKSVSLSFTDRMLVVFHTPQNLVLGLNNIHLYQPVRWLILLVLIAALLFAYIKLNKRNEQKDKLYREKINVITVTGTLLVIFFAVFFAVTNLDYTDKYLTTGFPLVISFLSVFSIYSLTKQRVVFISIILLYISILISEYRYPVKHIDSRSLAKYVTSIEQNGEPLLFYHKTLSLTFRQYYKGKNPVVPLPDSLKFDSTYFSKIKDTLMLKGIIENIKTDTKSYLFISDRSEPQYKNDEDIILVNNYLSDNYKITLDTMFYGYSKNFPLRIRRMEKK